MKNLKYAVGMLIILIPFLIFSAEPNIRAKRDVTTWLREDWPCAGWKLCEKTRCFRGGEEQCAASYCNTDNCGDPPPM